MATETCPADQILTTEEQVDKKMSEEVMATDQDSVSLLKGSEEERPKTEDLASPETPCEFLGTNDKKIELPVVEAEKTTDVPLAEVPVGVETKVENRSLPDPQAPDIEKQVFDVVESIPEVQSPMESVVVKEASTTPAIETTEIREVEQPKIVDTQSSVDAIEKPEVPLEVTPEKGSVEIVLEPELMEVKKPELSIAEVEEKPEELTEEVEKKHDEVVPEEPVQDETVKVEESVADKVEQTACLVEEKSETENTPTLAVEEEPELPKLTEEEMKPVKVGQEKSAEDETVKEEGSTVYNKVEEAILLEEVTTDKDEKPSLIPEDTSLSREDPIAPLDEGDSSLPDVIEQVNSEDQKKELSEVHAVEKLEEEAIVQNEKVEEENKNSDVINQDSTPPVDEDQKEEVGGVDVVEIAEKGVVELAGEKEVVTEADGKRNLIIEDSVQQIIEDQKTGLSGADVSEKLAEDAMVKAKVGEEIVAKKVETEDNEKRDVITEEPREEDQKKELGGVDGAEKLEEEAAVKLEDLGEEKVTKNVEIEENEKKNVITSDSVQPIEEEQNKELSGVDVDVVEKLAEVETEKLSEQNETKNVVTEVLTEPLKDEVNRSVPSFEVTEKSFEGAGKDVEPAVQNEHIKDEIPANVETTKDKSVEAVEEPVTDSKQSEAEVKGEETVKTEHGTLEKVTEDVAKSDNNVEPALTKDGDQTKPSEDLPKELPAKPSPKQANTILSKVKQSLVKAKKAITGKSPSSKTPPSGIKEDIKVK